jgi:undecaprenyl-diphosphatase
LSILEAIIIAIVEGITEFLPISSTGHMIITEHLLGLEHTPFNRMFMVSVQFGAILSVVVLYFKRFFQSMDFYFKLFAAFIPTALIGVLLKDHIDAMLESVTTVAIALLLGGVVFLFIDKYLHPSREKQVSYANAFMIGLIQCVSMIPGVSRSAATIIGGMTQGLTRKQAAEFSFFLAVPTMFGANVLEMYDAYKETPDVFSADNIYLLIIGNAVAFVVAMLAIRFFISYLTKHGFKAFGWYRIAVGAVLLGLLAAGVDLSIV